MTIGLLAGCASNPSSVDVASARQQTDTVPLKNPANRHVDAYATAYAKLPQAVRSTPREKQKANFGPPPPGYIRILGEAVPGWTPADVLLRGFGPLAWTPLGPRPIEGEYWSGIDDASGRVVSIAPHPVDPNIVYVASASGGIWKTTDGGGLWTPLTDELPNLNHGAVALDPANPGVIYAGTGEYTTFASGDGLFRSVDAGATWTRIATTAQVGSTCSGVIVDPANPNRLHVSGNLGHVRSNNGGSTWSVRLPGAVSSIAINPVNPTILYAGRHGDGVYRSTNRGLSWSKLTGGLPTTNISRILVAVAASNPSTVYAVFIDNNAGLRGFYQSTDGGNSWTQKPSTPDFPSPQGWYDAFVGVDPTNADTVYCGGVFPTYAVAGVIKTTDGGNSWTDITFGASGTQLHPDQHTIAFGPDGSLWVGNDGGVWRSTDGGANWINTNATLTVTQNYEVSLHPSDPAQIMGGTQDNGTVARLIDALGWPQILSGDGGFGAYDHANPNIVYTTYVYLSVYRLNAGGWTNISGPWSSESRNFIAPLVMDPADSHTLLGGTDRVWRTQNAHAGASWSTISGSNVAAGGTLNAIAIAPADSGTIYTGSSTGAVWVTTNAASWNDRSAGLPSGQVSDILIDPNQPATAYVAFHNTSGSRVLRTDDYGLNWTDVTGDLPAGVSARALAVDWRDNPPGLYVGTGVGVYSSDDAGTTWIKDGAEFPNVNIGDLQIDPVRRTITAGTYGRGAWRAALPCVEPVPGDTDADCDVDLSDLARVLAIFGVCSDSPSYDPNVDLDGSGCIDLSDLAVVLANFGA